MPWVPESIGNGYNGCRLGMAGGRLYYWRGYPTTGFWRFNPTYYQVDAAGRAVAPDNLHEAATSIENGTNAGGVTENLDANDAIYYDVQSTGPAGGMTTYDFTTGGGTDKWFYDSDTNDEVDDPPIPSDASWAKSTDYASIDASDDNRHVENMAADALNNPHTMFNFQISENPASLDNVEWSWEGHANGNNIEVFIWNPTSSAWESVATDTSAATADVTLSGAITNDPENYFDADDNFRLCAMNDTNKGTDILTDYVKIGVTISPSAAVLDVRHDSEPITGSQASVENIGITFDFISDNDADYQFQIHNFDTQNWENLDTGNVGASGVTWESTITVNPENYISSSDNIRVKLHGENSSAPFMAREDLLEIIVNYYTPGRYTSQVFDAEEVVDWNNISWSASTHSIITGENDNVGAEPDPLVDGESRVGENLNALSYAQTQDGSYENINENSITTAIGYQYVQSEDNWEGATLNFANAQDDNNAYENVYEKDYGGGGGGWETYDYSSGAGADKWAYEGSGANDAPPDSPGGTEFTAYDNIASSDNTRYTTGGGGATNNPYHDFHFKIGEDPATIENIAFHWEGYGDAGTSTLYIWDFTSSSWTELGSHTSTIADEIVDNWMTANISNYIDADDNLHLCAVDIANKPTFIKTDYVKVYVKTPPTVAYRENVEHRITGIPSGYEFYELQIEYYIGGDANENIMLYLENFASGNWDYIVNFGSTVLENFTYNLTGTHYISADDNVHVRYVQPDNDSTRTDLMIDYARVRAEKVVYALRWEHRISGVDATTYEDYQVVIYGYSGTDENIVVSVWNDSASGWEPIENLGTSPGDSLTYTLDPISNYVWGPDDNVSIKFEDWDNTDPIQTNIHIDQTIVAEVNIASTSIGIYARASSDGSTWTDWEGPYLTPSGSTIGLGGNRYIQYKAEFTSENDTLTPVLEWVEISY